MEKSASHFIKTLYLYVVAFVALMMVVFSTADIINTTLRTFIFTKADYGVYYGPDVQCASVPTEVASSTGEKMPPCITKEEMDKRRADEQTAQRQRDLVRDISYIVVGIPLFLFHWRIIRRKED